MASCSQCSNVATVDFGARFAADAGAAIPTARTTAAATTVPRIFPLLGLFALGATYVRGT
jgi:hypothetical protein